MAARRQVQAEVGVRAGVLHIADLLAWLSDGIWVKSFWLSAGAKQPHLCPAPLIAFIAKALAAAPHHASGVLITRAGVGH